MKLSSALNGLDRPIHVRPLALEGVARKGGESKLAVAVETPRSLSKDVAPSGPYTSDDDEFGFPIAKRILPAHATLKTFRNSPSGTALPPPLHLSSRFTRTLRFVNVSASAATFTAQSIACAFGCIGTSVVTVQPWLSSLRILRLTIWPAAGGFAEIYWNEESSGLVPDDVVDRTLPLGVTVTGAVSSAPPPMSLAKFWRNASSSGNLLTITSSVGSVLDFKIEATQPGVDAFAVQTVTTAVVNSIYYLALDGPSGNNYRPVVLSTTS
jgi:hypothetical protein